MPAFLFLAGAAGQTGAQRQQRAAGALTVPGGALGASAWLRLRHGAGRSAVGTSRRWRCRPGWSRACLLALLFPLPWRLFPRLFPRGLNACER